MRIIDPENTAASRFVQRQRIADAVRPGRFRRDALRHDRDPETATNFRQQAVEIEQPLEAFVPWLHLYNISDTDNLKASLHVLERSIDHEVNRFDQRIGRKALRTLP